MTAFIGQCLQGVFPKVLEKQYLKEGLGLLFLPAAQPNVQEFSSTLLSPGIPNPYLLATQQKKHVQLYLRLPHCIIPNIFIPSGTEHLHTPSLQEASAHALETASCWASGPRVSAPANATDISVYVMPLVGGSPSPVCSHRSVATAAGLPLPTSLCHTTTKFVSSQRAGGTVISPKTYNEGLFLIHGLRQ